MLTLGSMNGYPAVDKAVTHVEEHEPVGLKSKPLTLTKLEPKEVWSGSQRDLQVLLLQHREL